jgi:predicted MFS family arabinose efflux permease
MVADLAPENFRGTAFGFFHFTIGVGALPASLLFGLVWQTWGAAAAFTMGAVLAIIASGLLFFIPPPRG